MSDEQKLDDEAPPEIPDISSSPPPPPSEGVGDELEDDIEMDEHDDEDVAVEDEEVSVAGDDEEEIEPEPRVELIVQVGHTFELGPAQVRRKAAVIAFGASEGSEFMQR